ncbi:hypothetical protein PVK06_004755 [Gossypium arboreum]|uniref:UBN2 domain-containing protein n=1 Tax=Gossypium arboreum TaxID=29729 RepID=A0ABR0QTW6_GOSAR|nr:hypothetical protein PVK06_004755 [Gossypium arboreum]
MDGPSIPLKQERELLVPGRKKEWNEEDKKSIQFNFKATRTYFCALSPENYSKVSSCSNANEIWDKLEFTHVGTNQVMISKPKEDIKATYDRFTIIINGLNSYGKTYPDEEVVRKRLRSLLISWEAKVTAKEESKNFETLLLDKLISSLVINEMRLKEGNEKKGRKEGSSSKIH